MVSLSSKFDSNSVFVIRSVYEIYGENVEEGFKFLGLNEALGLVRKDFEQCYLINLDGFILCITWLILVFR